MDKIKLLKQSYLCYELNEKELADVAEIVSIKDTAKGEILFFQGDPAKGFYTLIKGRIRIYKSSPDGKEYTLHIIRPGQMFAEAAIFGSSIYPAYCTALEDSTVAFFPKERFISLITRSPNISLKMIAALSAFVREFNQKVEDLSIKEVSSRLAAYILDQSMKTGSNILILETSKSDLAGYLGTISATLSRNFKKLKELKIIDVSGKKITILNRNRLEDIAAGEKI
jgi:CRP/FNR family transcriptional regulator